MKRALGVIGILVLIVLSTFIAYSYYWQYQEEKFSECIKGYKGPGGMQEVCGRTVIID